MTDVPRQRLPSVDKVLGGSAIAAQVARHGRPLVLEAVRAALAERRNAGVPEAPPGARAGSAGLDTARSLGARRRDVGSPAPDTAPAADADRTGLSLPNGPSANPVAARVAVDATPVGFADVAGQRVNAMDAGPASAPVDAADPALIAAVIARLRDGSQPSMRAVHNLTGTVLHTNLGRAPLPAQALAAIVQVAGGATNLEFDLARGQRGDRDTHVEALLQRLTGAEAATVVNNNAAALLLVLGALARRREVIVSRGELVEIGGAFRLPEVMQAAGCKLVEVGTTNRTHLRDFEQAIGPRTAMVLKVHTSNYRIEGFSAAAAERDIAALCKARSVPFVIDLGSGALVDLSRHGLPREPLPGDALAAGADLVTFSGDKLLGGPQAGIVVGRADLVARCKKNPLKRALRCDKMTLAALGAVLQLHTDPDRLAQTLPALRLLTRPAAEIEAMAQRLQPVLAAWAGARAQVDVTAVRSQIGSGAMPVDLLPSHALRLTQRVSKQHSGRALEALAAALRALPQPVIGRITQGALLLDLRCLEDVAGFAAQLVAATPPDSPAPSAPT